MPIDPSFLPPASSPDDLAARRERLPVSHLAATPLSAATPHMGHTLLFGLLVAVAGFVVGIIFELALMHFGAHLREPVEQMQTDPLLVIPVEAVLYAVAAVASFLIFPLFWGRPFSQGVHWRAYIVRRRWWVLVGIGVATSVVVQILSNFLPIPKELPIDKFFTHRMGVWLIAIFGVTVAPAFEELAFRGFLLPSLASAWDWVMQRARGPRELLASPGVHQIPESEWQREAALYSSLPPAGASVFHHLGPESDSAARQGLHHHPEHGSGPPDPRWSKMAIVFATIITSIGFAMLHGAQLAHSFAPLAVLFSVSVVLCATRLRFHSLAASTLVHSMYNATIFIMLFIGTDGFRHLDKLGK
ncbi:MAG: CPBP family intramembrane glutamic endopeptidase [Acidobacteriaceae bacterium]